MIVPFNVFYEGFKFKTWIFQIKLCPRTLTNIHLSFILSCVSPVVSVVWVAVEKKSFEVRTAFRKPWIYISIILRSTSFTFILKIVLHLTLLKKCGKIIGWLVKEYTTPVIAQLASFVPFKPKNFINGKLILKNKHLLTLRKRITTSFCTLSFFQEWS